MLKQKKQKSIFKLNLSILVQALQWQVLGQAQPGRVPADGPRQADQGAERDHG